jgi:hypothetical protein
MNDEEMLTSVRATLTQARDSLDGVHMQRPATVLVARARARQRRRWLSGGGVACAALAVGLLLAGVLPTSGATPGRGTSVAQARTLAYVVSRVEHALASEHQVFVGRTTSTWGPNMTWAYGPRNRFEEFTGKACGHTDPNGWCTYHGGSVPFLAEGTALIGGRLRGAYVTYYDHRYSLSGVRVQPVSACSTDDALSMGGPPVVTPHWSAFVKATLACGAASVTGHVWIGGVETTKITGKPVTVKLSGRYAGVVGERWCRAHWILYVNPTTYLPVRIYGSTQTFGGPRHSFTNVSVTNVTWLRPTPGNIAKALVRIPPGFHQWSGNRGNQ